MRKSRNDGTAIDLGSNLIWSKVERRRTRCENAAPELSYFDTRPAAEVPAANSTLFQLTLFCPRSYPVMPRQLAC